METKEHMKGKAEGNRREKKVEDVGGNKGDKGTTDEAENERNEGVNGDKGKQVKKKEMKEDGRDKGLTSERDEGGSWRPRNT